MGGFIYFLFFCILDKSSILDVFFYIIYIFLMRVRNIKVRNHFGSSFIFLSKSIGGFYFYFIFCILDKSSILNVFLYIIYFFLMRVRNIKVLNHFGSSFIFSSKSIGGCVFFAFWISQVFWMFFLIYFFSLCVSETLRCLITLEAVLFFSPNL